MRASVPAVAYMRMSTLQQKYSIENQLACIREYAALRGFQLIRLYADEGRSGLRLRGRTAFLNLIKEVSTGKPDFSAILVYDVSRWGRFQSSDEAAYHEHTFARAGVKVHYCSELFENDQSLSSTVVKAVKRVMAAEYSRELSAKIFASQRHLCLQGYWSGGFAGHGLRRVAVDKNDIPQQRLEFGERKAIGGQRTKLIHGPESEIETVRRIYRLFVEDRLKVQEIRDLLNREHVLRDPQHPRWTSPAVKGILTNEKYTGENIFNKRSCKLGERQVRNDPQEWVRSLHGYRPIVDKTLFDEAQERLKLLRQNSDDVLLDQLRDLYETYGFLSGRLINSQREMRSANTYAGRFGGLKHAFKLVGCNTLSTFIPAKRRKVQKKHH